MSKFNMIPVAPEPPSQAEYPLQALELFPRLTRAIYAEKFGEEAAPWDTTKRIKRWGDTSVLASSSDPDSDLVSYLYFERDTQGVTAIKKMTITVRQASEVNLPGTTVYPKYTVAATPAEILLPDGSRTPLGSAVLATREQAELIRSDIQGSDIQASDIGSPFAIDWHDDARRQYTVLWRGRQLLVATLIGMKYANGIGAPGSWDLAGQEPRWISSIPQSQPQDLRPEIPMPVRPLKPFETVKSTLFGALIHRSDLPDPNAPVAMPGAGLTPEQDTRLKDIQSRVTKLLQLQLNV
jgi:hypothetical protein